MRVSVLVRRGAMAAALAAVVLLAGCGGGKGDVKRDVKRATVAGDNVTLEVPEAFAKQVSAKAVSAATLQFLPPVAGKTPPVAAVEIESQQSRYPDGVRITWTLPAKRPAGTELHVVSLDENERRWYGTGDKAVVAKTGDRATATVYHLSTLGVTDQTFAQFEPSRKPVVVDPNGRFTSEKEDKSKTERYVARVYTRSYNPPVVSHDKKADTAKAYKNLTDRIGAQGDISFDEFKKFVGSTDYAAVKALIEAGDIPQKHNYQLADWRIHALVESIKDFCAKNPGTRVYRSDTGNQKNAYLSDVDQTIFVYRYENGQWVRWAEGDAAMKGHVERKLRESGIPMEKMEVETMLGRDRFIDERLLGVDVRNSLPDQLKGKKRGVVITFTNVSLGRQPGAYFLAGTVKLQQQLRVKKLAETHLTGDILPDDRPITVAETKNALGRLNGQVCTVIGPADDNPKGEIKVAEGNYDDAKRVLMDGMHPDLQRGWAYDSSVDNWFKYNEKVKYSLDPSKIPAIKYPLRAVNDGPGILRAIERGTPPKVYEDLGDAERKQFLRETYGADLDQSREGRWSGRDGTSFLDRWKSALDVCATLRNISAVEKRPVTPADLENAFRPLAEKIAGPGNEGRWKEFLGQARVEYNARCQEIMTHNMILTSKERILGWLTPDPDNPKNREEMIKHVDESEIRRSLGMEAPEFDGKWQKVRAEIFGNYADTARIQLLFSFRYMNKDVIDLILKQAEANPKLSKADVDKLRGLAAEARSKLFHVRRAWELPALYAHIIGEWSKFHLDALGKRVYEQMLGEVGWIETKGGHVPNPMIGKLGLQGLDDAVQGWFKKYNKTAGFGARFLRNMVVDVGNIDGVAQVIRAWSESGGDPDAIKEAMVRETLYAVPVLGQVLSLSQIQTPLQAASAGILMGCAMASPWGRGAMIVFSVGDAGVAIYYSDYRAPLANAVADAVYRGFTGPSLYNFGSTPVQFTDDDQAKLDQAESDLRVMKLTMETKEQMAGLLAQQRMLEDKKERWKGYVLEQSRYQGGTLTGTAAQLSQKPLELSVPSEFDESAALWAPGPMLARVKPRVLFTSTSDGPVEFYVEPLTAAEQARMKELEGAVEAEKHPLRKIELAEELEKLSIRHAASERAQRYMERAKAVPELMHQIRVDSLWPYMLKDTSNEMVNPAKFVDDWCAIRREALPPALAKIGVETDWKAIRDAREQLAERLLEDTKRSRERWEEFERFKKGREKAVAQWYENARIRVSVEAVMTKAEENENRLSAEANAALESGGLKREMQHGLGLLGEAVANRHVPLSPPEVRIGGYVVRGDPDAKKAEEKEDVFYPSVKVNADPVIFAQPYSYSVSQINPEGAKKAVGSRSFEGLPLDDKMVESLQAYIKAVPEPKSQTRQSLGDGGKKDEKTTPAFLVFAFCTDFRLPARVVPKTMENVPRLKKFKIPGGGGEACLLGGAALWADLDPSPDAGPFKVETRRPRMTGYDRTEFVITSDSLNQLDSQKEGNSLRYTVYASPTKDEKSFMEVWHGEFLPNKPPIEEDKGDVGSKRIAQDKVIIVDNYTGNLYYKHHWPKGRLYFRVGERWVLEGSKEQKETLSEVLEPRDLAIVLHSSGDQKLDPFRSEETVKQTDVWMYVGIGPANQGIGYPGAHLKVSEGGRTYHYYTPRMEGDQTFESDSFGNLILTVRFEMRLPPAGGSVDFAAKYDGESVSRALRVTVAMDDKQKESLQNELKGADANNKTMRDMHTGEIKEMAVYIARDEKFLGERPSDVKTYWQQIDYSRAELDKVGCEANVRILSECRIPFSQALADRGRALREGNWAAAGTAVRALYDARKRQTLYFMEMLRAKKAVEQRLYALPEAPSPGKLWDDYDANIAGAWREYLYWLREEANVSTKVAYEAGDPQLYRRVGLLGIAALNEIKSAPREIGDRLKEFANGWAHLSDDREGAAAMYVLAYKLMDGSDKMPWNYYGGLPAWWPPASDGKTFVRPSAPGLDSIVSEYKSDVAMPKPK